MIFLDKSAGLGDSGYYQMKKKILCSARRMHLAHMETYFERNNKTARLCGQNQTSIIVPNEAGKVKGTHSSKAFEIDSLPWKERLE